MTTYSQSIKIVQLNCTYLQDHEKESGCKSNVSSVTRNSEVTNNKIQPELSLSVSSGDNSLVQNLSNVTQEPVQPEVSHTGMSAREEVKLKNTTEQSDSTTAMCSSSQLSAPRDISGCNTTCEMTVKGDNPVIAGCNANDVVEAHDEADLETSSDSKETNGAVFLDEASGMVKSLTDTVKIPHPLRDMKLTAPFQETPVDSAEKASEDVALLSNEYSASSTSKTSQPEEVLCQKPTVACGCNSRGQSKVVGSTCGDLNTGGSIVLLPKLEALHSENTIPHLQVVPSLKSTSPVPTIPSLLGSFGQKMDSSSSQDVEVSRVHEAMLQVRKVSKQLPEDVVKELSGVSSPHDQETSNANTIRLEPFLVATENSCGNGVGRESCSSMMEKVVLSFIRTEEEDKFPFVESDNEIELDEDEGKSDNTKSVCFDHNLQDVPGDCGSIGTMNYGSPSPLHCGPDVDTMEDIVSQASSKGNCTTNPTSTEEPSPKRVKLLAEPELGEDKMDDHGESSTSDGSSTLLQELPSESAKSWPVLPDPPPCRRQARQNDSSDEGDDNDDSNPPSCGTLQETIKVDCDETSSINDQIVPEDAYQFRANSCSLYSKPEVKGDKYFRNVPDEQNLVPKTSATLLQPNQLPQNSMENSIHLKFCFYFFLVSSIQHESMILKQPRLRLGLSKKQKIKKPLHGNYNFVNM